MKKTFFSGNIASDPELRGTDHKALVFRIAVNDRILNSQTGEWEDAVDFFPLVMFGNRAVALAQYLAKGTNVMVEATPRQNVWVTQDGSKRSQVEFIIDDINFANRAPATA